MVCNSKVDYYEFGAIADDIYQFITTPSALCHTGKTTQNIPDIYSESFWSDKELEEDNSTATLTALGINNSFATHPLLAVLEIRISTFHTYPHTCRSTIDVDLLADVGYFYQGN